MEVVSLAEDTRLNHIDVFYINYNSLLASDRTKLA